MEEFPDTKQAAEIILKIIRKARNRIVLISPYVDPTEKFFFELENASNCEKNIFLICIESKIKPLVKVRLAGIKNLEILNHEGVHAKCYYNEDFLLQTSLNLLRYSEEKKIENGTLIKKEENPDRFYKALALPEMIFRDSVSKTNRGNASKFQSQHNFANYKLTFFKEVKGQTGKCIRCRNELNYLNGNFPLCHSCYNTWSKFYNWDFEEHYCHWCGIDHATSKRKPFCFSCWQKYVDEIKGSNLISEQAIKENKPELKEQLVPPHAKESISAEEEVRPIKNKQGEPQQITPPLQNKKSFNAQHSGKKKYFVYAIASFLLLFILFKFLYPANQDYYVLNDGNNIYIAMIHSYYYDENKNKLQPGKYFAPAVDQYFQVHNTTPKKIKEINSSLEKEFINIRSSAIDSTFAFSKDPTGNFIVELWINYDCFRKSKNQFENALVREQFVFNPDRLIISLRELETKNLRFTSKKMNLSL